MSQIDYLNKEIVGDAIRINGSKNCPNCGAPIDSEKCEYCGTVFIDFACMDTDKPFFMKIKCNGEIHILKVMMRSATHSIGHDTLYVNDVPYLTLAPRISELTIDFDVYH